MKIRKFKLRPIRLLRGASQILFFIFLPALYLTAFDGIRDIFLSIYKHNFNLSAMLPQIVIAAAVLPVTLLLGRFFCGWMCAFGAMGDFISMLAHKIFKRKLKISVKADKALKVVKYIWLCFLAVAVWGYGIKAFGTSNPWDAFGMLITPGSLPDFAYVISCLTPAFFILLIIILGSFFVDRFFCRYLCPLGAVFSIISKLRITGIRKRRTKCGNCRVCTNSCPMGISLYQKDLVKSGECINCFECFEACPQKNVSLAVSDDTIRPAFAGAMAVAVMAGIYYAGSFESNLLMTNAVAAVKPILPDTLSSAQSASSGSSGSGNTQGLPQFSSEPSTSSSAPSLNTAKYKDGTYQGSGIGFRQQITTVSVTVKDGKITDIQVISTGDSMQFFSRAYYSVTQSIISNQSPHVDAVSGATYSSDGIMQAVSDALSKA